MKNVYDRVQAFYAEYLEWEPLVLQEWVEGFLRQKAWQGEDDAQLSLRWNQLAIFIRYLDHSYKEALDDIALEDYVLMVEWIAERVSGFSVSMTSVRFFFQTLLDFYHYLARRNYIQDVSALREAAKQIAGNEQLERITPEGLAELLRKNATTIAAGEAADAEFDMAGRLTQIVERLMFLLGEYFQKPEFAEDFERALFLYSGPMLEPEEQEEEEFWLGFWDYFLFDYRLLDSDKIPLAFFAEAEQNKLGVEENNVLQDLLQAQFTVFYVERMVNSEWVECINLLTEERFELPLPDFEYRLLKRQLFFGHVFAQGVVMINYVSSIEMSSKLRTRIKQEVLHQQRLFQCQQPAASMTDFLQRHAVAVRHTIHILVTLARLNVVSHRQVEVAFPEPRHQQPMQTTVAVVVEQLAGTYGFSLYDKRLLQRMWQDVCQQWPVPLRIRKPMLWAAALFYAFTQMNVGRRIPLGLLANELQVSASSILRSVRKIETALQLQLFDARYLNEEGFVALLYHES